MEIRYDVMTSKDMTKAIDALKEALKERDFGVLWEMDFKSTLEGKGLDLHARVHMLEVCNPLKAKEVLEIDPAAGLFLPCKMVVYEKKGEVYFGLISPTTLVETMGSEKLSAIGRDIEAVLHAAMKEAK